MGKNSQNSAHLRIIRTAPAMRRRKRELFAKIRICDVGSPAQMRIIFRKKFLCFEKMRRVFAAGSPAQMRSIFRRWEKFFAVANNSYLRRILGANANYFSQMRPKFAVFSKYFSQMRKIFRSCEKFVFASNFGRKCELFFADEKNFSQLRILYFRKWSRNTAEIGLSLLVFELNHFKDLRILVAFANYFSPNGHVLVYF